MPKARSYLEIGEEYQSLSIKDLLEARDAYHVFLTRRQNVVGTAIGRFRVRKIRGYPGPKTLQNTEIRPYSWPCIMVLVKDWITLDKFGHDAHPLEDYLPQRLYLPDGRGVPVCVIKTSWQEGGDEYIPAMSFPGQVVGGGYPIMTKVQGTDRWATLACLVTDGRLTYGLTNSHVAGCAGEGLFTQRNGDVEEIGISSDKSLKKVQFESAYEGLPGKHTLVNMDIGLINFNDTKNVTSQVYGLGQVRGLVDVNHDTLSLKLVGCQVVGYGCSSGIMKGEIIGLFYRYTTSGGYDYVSDYLVGPRPAQKGQAVMPFNPRPGDSGTLMVIDDPASEEDKKAIGVLWGGQKDVASGREHPYGLVTNLGTICRQLDVELVCDWNAAYKPYFGAYAHVTLPSLSIDLIKDGTLRQLMENNSACFCMPITTTEVQQTHGLSKSRYIPLSDVPDLAWKFPGHWPRQFEKPNHFANMDQPDPENENKTLLDLCEQSSNVDPAVWIRHYDDIDEPDRGALPFRIAQLYDAMVKACEDGSASDFVGAAGVLTHYVMDAAQPLHITYMYDGDPNGPKKNDKNDNRVPLAKGVHSEFDDYIVETKHEEISETLGPIAQGVDAGNDVAQIAEITTTKAAAIAAVTLMKNTVNNANPIDIVKDYEKLAKAKKRERCDQLWLTYGVGMKKSIAEGVVLISRLWEAAWLNGKGKDRIASTQAFSDEELSQLYAKIYTKDNDFLASVGLEDVCSKMRWK